MAVNMPYVPKPESGTKVLKSQLTVINSALTTSFGAVLFCSLHALVQFEYGGRVIYSSRNVLMFITIICILCWYQPLTG